MSEPRWTPELRKAFNRLQLAFEDKCEMIWDDMKFEFGLKHDLDESEVDDLEEAQ